VSASRVSRSGEPQAGGQPRALTGHALDVHRRQGGDAAGTTWAMTRRDGRAPGAAGGERARQLWRDRPAAGGSGPRRAAHPLGGDGAVQGAIVHAAAGGPRALGDPRGPHSRRGEERLTARGARRGRWTPYAPDGTPLAPGWSQSTTGRRASSRPPKPRSTRSPRRRCEAGAHIVAIPYTTVKTALGQQGADAVCRAIADNSCKGARRAWLNFQN
jgi:hypothetical protein